MYNYIIIQIDINILNIKINMSHNSHRLLKLIYDDNQISSAYTDDIQPQLDDLKYVYDECFITKYEEVKHYILQLYNLQYTRLLI